MSLSNKSIPGFWYYLRNIKAGVDNLEFGVFYDLMTRFMVLPVYCMTRKKFSFANHIETNTNLLKPRLFRKIVIKTSIVKKQPSKPLLDT